MNKPQAEGRVNHISVQYIAGEEGSTLFSNKKLNNEAQLLVYLKSFLLISLVELDHQRSAAETLVNKMRLDIFVLSNIFNYCRFVSYYKF